MTGSSTDAPPTAPTGERFDPPFMSGRIIEAEHFARYAWAARFASGRRVLDAACGMAYGTAMLAAAGATEAVGVDQDEGVIARVGAAAPSSTRFDVADLRELPYGDDEFDLVVCFEAIEHVPEPEVVLDELARVLGPDGLLIVSTPNRDVYTPGNPFHLRELTPNELAAELSQRFQSVALRRQHSWVASGIFDDEAFTATDHEPIDGVEVRKACADQPGQETYTIGMASNGKLPADTRLVSLTSDIDIRDWSARLDAADLAMLTPPTRNGKSEAEVELLRGEVGELRRQLASGEAELSRLTELEAKLAATTAALADYEALSARYNDVVASPGWKVIKVLRRLNAMVRGTRS